MRYLDAQSDSDVRVTLARIIADFDEIVDIAINNSSVLDRLHGTGRLTEQTARDMQVAGLPARASGIDADARRDHPFAAYGQLPRTGVHWGCVGAHDGAG